MRSWSFPWNHTYIFSEKKKRDVKFLLTGKVQRWQVPVALSHYYSYQFSFMMASCTFKGKRWQWFQCSNVKCAFMSPGSKQWPWCSFVIKIDCKPMPLNNVNFMKLHLGACRRMISVFWDTTTITSFYTFCLKQLCGMMITISYFNKKKKQWIKELMQKYNMDFVLCSLDC